MFNSYSLLAFEEDGDWVLEWDGGEREGRGGQGQEWREQERRIRGEQACSEEERLSRFWGDFFILCHG